MATQLANLFVPPICAVAGLILVTLPGLNILPRWTTGRFTAAATRLFLFFLMTTSLYVSGAIRHPDQATTYLALAVICGVLTVAFLAAMRAPTERQRAAERAFDRSRAGRAWHRFTAVPGGETSQE